MPKTNEELYEEAERQLIGEAIAETEQEIHDSAFDNAPDDNDGDTSLEEMDSDDVVDDDIGDQEGDEFEAEDEDDREPTSEEKDQDQAPVQTERVERSRIPPERLRAEADARRTAEAEREAARAELRELRARIEAQERFQRQPQQPQQQQPQGPDMFADPDGWANAQRQQIRNEFRTEMVNASFADAAEQHGGKFDEAWKSINSLNPQNPADLATAQSIWNAPNPGRALMKWHDQQSLLREIGTDPAAYRQKLRDELINDPEFRQQMISGARQDAVSNRRTNVQLPPSLNGASGGTSHRGRDGGSRDTAHTTRSLEREIFDSAWDD